MGWIRRHPIASAILGLLLVLFIIAAVSADDPLATALSLAVLYLLFVGVTLLLTWVWAKVRRSSEKSPGSTGVPPSPAPGTSQGITLETPSPMPGTGPDGTVVTPPATSVVAPTLGDLLVLTPSQFENLTARVLTALGYKDVTVVGGAGDLAADLSCRDPQGRLTVVQCKRFAPGSSVGTPVIQTFIGMIHVHHRAERGIVVTSATFTQPAIELARQHGIALVDGDSLRLLVHLTGVPVLPPAPRTHIYCRQCGAQNPIGDRFCAACGAQLGQRLE
ncbi:MAG: hypothetical protein KatS3mg059_1711 [Thermomicrobiales bacterium]|nr:MAG: hypothetical protein KatS3mg059_1711 [Thermomicrobiales bacterium]